MEMVLTHKNHLKRWFFANKKTPFRVLKLWCEQSTSATLLPRLATLRVLAPLLIKKTPFRVLKLWCEQRGSNPRPQPWQGCALAN